MNVKTLSIILFILGASVFLFSENTYADQPPALVSAVNNDSYYFAEDNFGIDILRLFNAPLTPYLT